jgi:hypothetical protein
MTFSSERYNVQCLGLLRMWREEEEEQEWQEESCESKSCSRTCMLPHQHDPGVDVDLHNLFGGKGGRDKSSM